MAKIQVWHDSVNRLYRLDGSISERDMAFQPAELIEGVKHEIISRLANLILEECGPQIEEVVRSAWERRKQ